jgi:outer membrane protein OmpA-like peptidoglycan-associated protein
MKLHQGSQIIPLLAGLLLSASALHAEPPNLASDARGAKIAGFSSNYAGFWDVTNLIGGNEDWSGALPVWCTESEAKFPHWAVIELPRKEWLTTLIFNNAIPDEGSGWPGISAKDVRLEVSTTSATEDFKTVVSFQLERNKNNQLVRIEPVEARWLKIVITSNWGHPEYTELGKLGAFDDGTRAINIAEALKTKGFVDVYGIYFDFGSAKLRPESDPVLKQIAGYLQGNPEKKVSIEGHTDTIGDEKANQLLSENRAKAVVEALKGFQVKPGVLTAAGYGASKPVGDNKTINGRAQNRRVTVRVAK